MTRDPQKVAFNIGDSIISTFLAGVVYLAFVPPHPAFVQTVLPAFAATAVDFMATTVVLAGVLALASERSAWQVWHENYQWGLPSYMTGATLSLLVAWLYIWLGMPGLVLGLPPLFLIWYSYDVYAGRMRDRATYTSEVASFRDELAAAVRSQDELRAVQHRVAGEIERARSIQADLLPRHAPEVPGLELAHRIEFMTEMGGDYFDFVPLADGRLGLVCGDVMGKGLSAALIMTMARSLILSAARDGRRPGEVLSEVNDSLTRDLAGQSAPSFLTLAYAIYSPDDRTLVVANGGHNPLLVYGPGGLRELTSRGSMLGVRGELEFPEDNVTLEPGDTFALFTDGLTEARNESVSCSGQTARRRVAQRRGHAGQRRPGRRLAGRERLPRGRAGKRRRHAPARSRRTHRGSLDSADTETDDEPIGDRKPPYPAGHAIRRTPRHARGHRRRPRRSAA